MAEEQPETTQRTESTEERTVSSGGLTFDERVESVRELRGAVDLDDEGEVIDADLVGTTLTADEAEKRAERWCENNPKGLAGEKSGLGALLGG